MTKTSRVLDALLYDEALAEPTTTRRSRGPDKSHGSRFRRSKEKAGPSRPCLGPGAYGGGCNKKVNYASPHERVCRPCRLIIAKLGG